MSNTDDTVYSARFADQRIQSFMDDILAVYEKHSMAISHEDQHGAFIIVPVDQDHVDWLCGAGSRLAPVPDLPPRPSEPLDHQP